MIMSILFCGIIMYKLIVCMYICMTCIDPRDAQLVIAIQAYQLDVVTELLCVYYLSLFNLPLVQ
jgi:membrane-anchored glycerophosphoryl diester phosphodiesterase (GDPDase)